MNICWLYTQSFLALLLLRVIHFFFWLPSLSLPQSQYSHKSSLPKGTAVKCSWKRSSLPFWDKYKRDAVCCIGQCDMSYGKWKLSYMHSKSGKYHLQSRWKLGKEKQAYLFMYKAQIRIQHTNTHWGGLGALVPHPVTECQFNCCLLGSNSAA